jgi:hypothetical protein
MHRDDWVKPAISQGMSQIERFDLLPQDVSNCLYQNAEFPCFHYKT